LGGQTPLSLSRYKKRAVKGVTSIRWGGRSLEGDAEDLLDRDKPLEEGDGKERYCLIPEKRRGPISWEKKLSRHARRCKRKKKTGDDKKKGDIFKVRRRSRRSRKYICQEGKTGGYITMVFKGWAARKRKIRRAVTTKGR